MITKESLVQDREQSNVALLKLKQIYKNSTDDVFFVVEGKDDVAFFTSVSVRYPGFIKATILPANSRKNVINTYKAINWTVYAKERVLFFIDRDLSDITHEYTPVSPNVYISDYYSIENSIFDAKLMISALKIFYGVVDLSSIEEGQLIRLYNTAYDEFLKNYMLIMSWILFWKIRDYKCNLNNINKGDFYHIEKGKFGIKKEYNTKEKIIGYIHDACGITYKKYDIEEYTELINRNGGIEKNIRGKYIRSFFVKFILSVVQSFSALFPQRHNPKCVATFGEKNVLPLLCGYIVMPQSLNDFLSKKDYTN